MSIEVSGTNIVCSRCGKAYSRRKGYFAVNYGALYKGIGYLSVCKHCVEDIYNNYLTQCGNEKDAVRQTCRKLDIYWSEKVFNTVYKKSTTRTVMTTYLSKINTTTYAGKSYDDTLVECEGLWSFDETNLSSPKTDFEEEPDNDLSKVPEDVIAFWGTGYTADMYRDLEQRRSYWLSEFPKNMELDVGTKALIRQICALELDINRDRKNGKSVDKSVNALNTLLGSANLKPIQQKNEDPDSNIDKTPLGVWIQRFENKRPLPEVDPELKDVDGIIKYISTWFLGHLCKMLGIKNSYCKLYEDAIEKMRVEHPDLREEDDETLFNDIFAGSEQE